MKKWLLVFIFCISCVFSSFVYAENKESVKKYLQFKAEYEDRDFKVDRYIGLQISYGQTIDNLAFFDCVSERTDIFRDDKCRSGWKIEKWASNSTKSKENCVGETKLDYPLSLVFKVLSKEQLERIGVMWLYSDGDMNIRLKDSEDEKSINKIAKVLSYADELKDAKNPPTTMQPIIPAQRERLIWNVLWVDEDNDGERDFVLIPCSIDGSFFDEDARNVNIQVFIKHPVVTKDYLSEHPEVDKESLGAWIWDLPSEITIDFDGGRGFDIVFYDEGVPDGIFERYEFLK